MQNTATRNGFMIYGSMGSCAAPSSTPASVIVADDEVFIRLDAVYFLTDAGFAVLEAGHAADVLEILEVRAAEVHVLFTDVNMPGELNGIDLAHLVAERWPWIRLLVTSGRMRLHEVQLPTGSRFVQKPYEPEHVLTHVRDLVMAS